MGTSLIDYKELEVLDPDPTGAGGLALQNNDKKMADRAGPVAEEASDPTVNDDSADTAGNGKFYVWSKWRNTSTNDIFVCVDPTPTASVWIKIANIAQSDIVQQINAQVGTSYTLIDADHGKLVTLDNAAAIALSVNTGLRSDFACVILQKGAGQVTVAGTATVNEVNSLDKTDGQWAMASLAHLGSNVYVITGRLTS